MWVKAAGVPGMLRVRFRAGQRQAAIEELREMRAVSSEALETHRARAHVDQLEAEAAEAKLAAIDHALDQAEGTEPGRPFEIVAATWVVQAQTFGAMSLLIERVDDAAEGLRTGRTRADRPVRDARGDLVQALGGLRHWARTMLDAYEFPPASG